MAPWKKRHLRWSFEGWKHTAEIQEWFLTEGRALDRTRRAGSTYGGGLCFRPSFLYLTPQAVGRRSKPWVGGRWPESWGAARGSEGGHWVGMEEGGDWFGAGAEAEGCECLTEGGNCQG